MGKNRDGRPSRWLGGFLAATALAAGGSAEARIVRLDIQQTEAEAFEGKSFGAAGPYEILSGVAHGELDPQDPHNAIIQDLAFAPRNARGMVEYSATFSLARPRDMSKASGVLIYQVVNRGGGSVAGSPEGHISVISGWQGDMAPAAGRQTISVPTAHGPNGHPLAGSALARFVNVAAGTTTAPIEAGSGRPVPRPAPVSLDTTQAKLSWTRADKDVPTQIPASDWAFADCTKTPFPGVADPAKICLKDGFDPKRAYTLSYVAKDPLVLGMGYAATRDLIAFLRYAKADEARTANPALGGAEVAIGTGVSQSANFLRSMVHLDLNVSEDGRIVFDGILPSSSVRQNALNFRFAVPGGGAALYDYGTEGVMWWSPYTDRTRGLRRASLLDRCTASRTCPKIIEVLGASELWTLRGSPALVGLDAKADIALPANVRRYYNPGVTHTGGAGGFRLETPKLGACVLASNPNPASDTVRALTAALVDWTARGIDPPASRYPTISAGELVDPAVPAKVFEGLPGFPSAIKAVNPLPIYDYGKGFNAADLTGVISAQPPRIVGYAPLLVAAVDADGNETAGVRSVLNQVPLGTYVGWNITKVGYDEGLTCGSNGGFVPFAATRAQRIAAGDPRPSLEERYGDRDAYMARVRQAADGLVAARLLLADDAARIVREAEATEAFAAVK